MSFDPTTRNKLARMVAKCRDLLTEEFEGQLQERFGIYPADGRVLEMEKLPVRDDETLAVARLLRSRIDHLMGGGADTLAGAVKRVLREQAFTVLNRFAALRMAEERDIIPESVRGGMTSKGAQVFADLAGPALGDTYDRYRVYLDRLFDELSLDLKVLFDRFSPLALLFPRENVLSELLAAINAPDIAPLWAADETIGWIYQYYNDPEERKKMRKESAAPRNSRELAVRNQFFTPRYVVEFLTDNTLGRIWYEMTRGQTSLKEKCRYLVRRPNEVFLNPRFLDLHRGIGVWVQEVAHGKFNAVPKDASWEEIGTVALLFDGYEVAQQIHGKEIEECVKPLFDELEKSGTLPPASFLDLWLLLFSCQRGILREGNHERFPDLGEKVRRVWEAWCEAATAPQDTTGLSQEELLRQPVIIPVRMPKDPRDIRLLDPACGSMHFGLYAFDLFEIIYREAKEMGLLPPEAYCGDHPALDLTTVQERKDLTVVRGNDFGEVDAATACVVILEQGDFGDGLNHEGPFLTQQGRNFRPKVLREIPWSAFHFQQALQEGWMTPEQAERLVKETDAFTHNRIEPLAPDEQNRYLETQIPKLIIEHNIHGIDIDLRAVQIAGLSLWLRAQKAWQNQKVPAADRPSVRRSNIVCAEPMPGSLEMLEEFKKTLDPPLLGELVQTVFDKMQLAGEAGSLLKIEQEIRTAIDAARKAWEKLETKSQELFSTDELNQVSRQPELSALEKAVSSSFILQDSTFWETVEERLLEALREYAEQADADSYQRRLFADDAARGFAFIDLCRKRYDAVVMNPPFGEAAIKSTAGLKRYAIKNLYSCFVERADEISHPDGAFAAITDSTYLKQPTFVELRQMLLGRERRVSQIVDLGWGVLDANVRTALFVCHRRNARGFDSLDISDREDRGDLLLDASNQSLFVERSHTETLRLPKSVLALNLPVESTGKLIALDRVRSFAELPWGCGANDSFRLFRLRWEVGNAEIGDSWAFLTNGGEFAPLYRENYYLCRVRVENGESAFTTKFKNDTDNLYDASAQHLYYKPGLTYPKRSRFFHVAALPAGHIFTPEGKGFFLADSRNRFFSLAILNSSIVAQMADFLCGPHKQRGDVELIGVPNLDELTAETIAGSAQRALSALQSLAEANEDSALFCTPWPRSDSGNRLGCLKLLIERRKDQISQASRIAAEAFLDFDSAAQRACPWLPLDDGCIAELRTARSKICDSYAVAAEAHLSYLLGCSFGRWDISYATGERQMPGLPDPFDQLPICPPGMLQGDDGLPLSKDELRRMNDEGKYPLRVTVEGVMVDDENHPEDIVTRTREAIQVIWRDGEVGSEEIVSRGQKIEDSGKSDLPTPNCLPPTGAPPTGAHARAEAIEQEACEILGVRFLRDYFRRPAAFFADHLKRYSKSRRQAPIYWPISTKSGTYTLWLYYHRLNDQTLFTCVNGFVKPKIEEVTADLDRLRADNAPRTEIDDQMEFLSELTAFRDELLRIAALPWKPNLNDGVLITASPLWSLFRLPKWQKDLKACWQKLQKGDYDWAHLAYTLYPDRVKKACETDRSIAIAHGLDHLCKVEAPKAKKKRGKKAEDAELLEQD